jgi:ABC-type transporter lipoprotein component MlaA
MLPILGPSTLRDMVGITVDSLESIERVKSFNTIEKTSLSAVQAIVGPAPMIKILFRSCLLGIM